MGSKREVFMLARQSRLTCHHLSKMTTLFAAGCLIAIRSVRVCRPAAAVRRCAKIATRCAEKEVGLEAYR